MTTKTLVKLEVMSPAQILVATHDEMLNYMTPKERKGYSLLEAHLHDHISEDTIRWWTLGALIRDEMEKAEDDSEGYKPHLMERYAVALGFKRPHMIYLARRVAMAWKVKSEFMKEVVSPHNEEYRLNWTHIGFIAAVPSAAKRRQIITEAIRHKMTIDALRQMIGKLAPDLAIGTNNPEGKPVSIPKNVEDCLHRIKTIANQTSNLIDNAWTGERFDVYDAFKSTPPDWITSEFVDGVRRAFAAADACRESLAKLLARLSKVNDEATLRLADSTAKTNIREADENDETPGVKVDRKEDVEEVAGDGETIADWKKRQVAKNTKPKKGAKQESKTPAKKGKKK